MEEREILKDVLKQARICKTRLEAIVDFALNYLDKDLSAIFEKLAIALKVSEGVCCSLELFSIRNLHRPPLRYMPCFTTIFDRKSLLIKSWFAMQAIELAGLYDDDDGHCNHTLALSRYSWKVRVDRYLTLRMF